MSPVIRETIIIQLKRHSDPNGSAQIVIMDKLTESPKVDRIPADQHPVRVHILPFQQFPEVEQRLKNSALPGAVRAEQKGYRPQGDFDLIADSLEVLNCQLGNWHRFK